MVITYAGVKAFINRRKDAERLPRLGVNLLPQYSGVPGRQKLQPGGELQLIAALLPTAPD